jgi:cellobiose-specific phosphotransferase system component IIA
MVIVCLVVTIVHSGTKENSMFNILEETKQEAVAKMEEILNDADVAKDKIEEAFEAAVAVVKKQFGM